MLAAEITIDSPDFGHFEPVVEATVRELERAGINDKPKVAVADAGYWHEQQMDSVVANHGIQVLIPPDTPRTAVDRHEVGAEQGSWRLFGTFSGWDPVAFMP